MSRMEIISEIPKLSRADRREIMRRIMEVEGNGGIDLRARHRRDSSCRTSLTAENLRRGLGTTRGRHF
jgi:hypothetical protein